MISVIQLVERLADLDSTILILGESGSGKSVSTLAVMGLHNRKQAQITGQAILNLEVEFPLASGAGIPQEERARVFEAFYTTKPGGTGLGLAVTRTLLEKMGARIEAFRGSRGALFRVTLPMEQPA